MSRFLVFSPENTRMGTKFAPYCPIVHSNLLSGEFASIYHVKQIGMIVKELYNEKLYL